MKLGHWMHDWRNAPAPKPDHGDRAHPPSAVQTNAAATLRQVLTLLPEDPRDAAMETTSAELEQVLGQVEACGATLHEAQLEHSAGQMRLLWRSVHEGTLQLDEPIVSAMSQCVLYLLDHLTSGRMFPGSSPEMDAWNEAYQVAMARQEPVAPADTIEPRAAPAPPEVTVPRIADPIPVLQAETAGTPTNGAGRQHRERPRRPRPLSGALRRPDPGALDADELERLLLGRSLRAERPAEAG